jgi:DNA polymerase III delta subunit
MAVPNPARELVRLRAHVKNGLGRATVLMGVSPYFRGEALRAVIDAIPRQTNLRSIDAQEEETDGRELQDLRGGSLFGAGTWLVVRRAEKWLAAHGERLLAAIEGIGKGCGVVIEATKVDRRTKLGKALAGLDLFEFRELYDEPFDRSRSPLEGELVQWLVQHGRQVSVPLTPEAAFAMVTVVGKDPAELVRELTRLAESLGGDAGRRRPLSPDDLRGKLTCSFESTPFELAEALLAHDRKRCLRSLQAMFARGVKGREGAPMDRGGVFPFATSWLHNSLMGVHRGRVLVDSGTPLRDVASAAKVHAFADRYVKQVADNPEPRLRRGIELLLAAQRELRTSGEDPELLLERFVARYFARRRA